MPLHSLEASAVTVLGKIRTAMWSVEREPGEYKNVDEIIDDGKIVSTLEQTKEAAKDIGRIREILAAAQDRSFLKNAEPGKQLNLQTSNFVQLTKLLANYLYFTSTKPAEHIGVT